MSAMRQDGNTAALMSPPIPSPPVPVSDQGDSIETKNVPKELLRAKMSP